MTLDHPEALTLHFKANLGCSLLPIFNLELWFVFVYLFVLLSILPWFIYFKQNSKVLYYFYFFLVKKKNWSWIWVPYIYLRPMNILVIKLIVFIFYEHDHVEFASAYSTIPYIEIHQDISCSMIHVHETATQHTSGIVSSSIPWLLLLMYLDCVLSFFP